MGDQIEGGEEYWTKWSRINSGRNWCAQVRLSQNNFNRVHESGCHTLLYVISLCICKDCRLLWSPLRTLFMKLPWIAMVFPCERRIRGEKSVIPWEYTFKESLFFRWIDFESLVKLSNTQCVLPLNKENFFSFLVPFCCQENA